MRTIFVLLIISTLIFLPLGVIRADTTSVLRPLLDGGNDSASWTNTVSTACNSADCYIEVDESAGSNCTDSDGDTSYIESTVQDAGQTFNIDLSAITNNSTISQIDVTACHKRVGTTPPNQFQLSYCLDGSCSNSGTDIGAGGNYGEATQSFTGLSIAKTDSTDIEIGVTVSGNRNKIVRISQLAAVITYTPPQCDDGIDNDGDGGIDYPVDLGCDSASDNDETDIPSGGGSESGTAAIPSSNTRARKVIFSGQAYPGGTVEVYRKMFEKNLYIFSPLESSTINPDGTFEITQIGLFGADFFFALKALDPNGLSSGIISFDVDLASEDTLIAKNLTVPPTVDFKKSVVTKNENVDIFGYAAPKRRIEFMIDKSIAGETDSADNGAYSFSTSTVELALGEHYVQARQYMVGAAKENFSSSRAFKISTLKFPQADLNGDNEITVADWSIFLFNWQSQDDQLRNKIDFDSNGKIDIADLSIFLRAIKL